MSSSARRADLCYSGSMRNVIALLAIAFVSCATPQPAAPQVDYVAHFNEPFLTLTSAGNALELKSPHEMEGRSIASSRTALADGAMFEGMLDEAAPGSRFRLTVRERYCEDDMAGLPYSHTVVLERGANLELRPHIGCARLTTEPQPRER